MSYCTTGCAIRFGFCHLLCTNLYQTGERQHHMCVDNGTSFDSLFVSFPQHARNYSQCTAI